MFEIALNNQFKHVSIQNLCSVLELELGESLLELQDHNIIFSQMVLLMV